MELKRYQLAHSMVGCAEHCKNRIGQVHRGVAGGWSGHSDRPPEVRSGLCRPVQGLRSWLRDDQLTAPFGNGPTSHFEREIRPRKGPASPCFGCGFVVRAEAFGGSWIDYSSTTVGSSARCAAGLFGRQTWRSARMQEKQPVPGPQHERRHSPR